MERLDALRRVLSRRVLSGQGTAVKAGNGELSLVLARHVGSGHFKVRQSRLDGPWWGRSRQGLAVKEGRVMSGRVMAWHGSRGESSRGLAGQHTGMASHGSRGMAGRDQSRLGWSRYGSRGKSRRVLVWLGEPW